MTTPSPTAGGLKPCPFCGNTTIIYCSEITSHDGLKRHYCCCYGCKAKSKGCELPEPEARIKTAEAWNNRASLPTAPLGEDEKIVRDILEAYRSVAIRANPSNDSLTAWLPVEKAHNALSRLTSQPKPDERTLPEIPKGVFSVEILPPKLGHANWSAALHTVRKSTGECFGPTPRAAVLAAIERIK